jgi:hypothetical protein
MGWLKDVRRCWNDEAPSRWSAPNRLRMDNGAWLPAPRSFRVTAGGRVIIDRKSWDTTYRRSALDGYVKCLLMPIVIWGSAVEWLRSRNFLRRTL